MKLSKNVSSVAVLSALLCVPPIAAGDEGKIEIKVIQGLRLSWGDSRDNMTQLGVTRGAVTLKVAVEDMTAGSTRVIWLKAEIPDSTPPIVDFKRVHVTAGRMSAADFTDIKAPDTARRTYDYWVEVRDALRRGSPGKNPAPARLATSLKDSSKEIESLPTRGVDVEAVEAVLGLTEAFGQMSQWIEANLVNDRTLELMLRTVIADDPLALPQKIVGDKDSATNAFQRASKGCQRMRIKLTAKYGLEFPAFDAI